MKRVMRERLDRALDGAHDQGAILMVGHKPGIDYAYVRMTAREHVHAARRLLLGAAQILRDKGLIEDDDEHPTWVKMKEIERELGSLSCVVPSERTASKEKGSIRDE